MNSYSSVLNTLLIAVVIVACLFFAREVFIPITLAGILSFMLAPVMAHIINKGGCRVTALIIQQDAAARPVLWQRWDTPTH
jgi:predicted PurR-regulated permease PerM